MALMTLKVDDELKAVFADKCRSEGRPVSVVLREFMKAYIGASNRDDYSPEFYAKIEKAMKSPVVPMSREELRALHGVE